jgi:NADPH2:quinone reductase
MKAVYIKEFGSVNGLEIRELPDPPQPAPDQVLIRVHAAGLNRADLLQIRGNYPPPPGYSPNIPGLEFAGEVIAVRENVERWKIGDRVFSITPGEAQAEFLLTDERLLAKIPAGVSFTEAAAVPEAFITAHDAIITLGGLKKGETLLIHAVGSGVGLAGLQLAKAKGAFVIGTSRTQDKLDKCEEFGLDSAILADKAIDFASSVKNATSGKGVDVILDLVGAAYFQQNLESLRDKGRMILVGLTSGSKAEFDLGLALRKRLRIIGTVLRARSTDEKAEVVAKFASEVVPLFESGKIRPNLDRVFPVTEAIAAYKYLESNESFGKVILEI